VSEAYKRAESARTGLLRPLIKITHAAPHNQLTELLEQRVASVQTRVFPHNFVERVALILIELFRWAQA
jgi:hypothetical protein